MLNETFLVSVRRDLPQLLQADAEFLRLAGSGEIKLGDELLAEVAARAFREQRVLRLQLHAAREAGIRLLVLADAHVAGRYAGHRAIVTVKNFRRGKAGI